MIRILSLHRLMALFLLLGAALLVAPELEAKTKGARFHNLSGRTQNLLVAYGGDGTCSEMPTRENLTLEKGEKVVVESADSKVCWCSSPRIEIDDCTDAWKTLRAGGYKRIEA